MDKFEFFFFLRVSKVINISTLVISRPNFKNEAPEIMLPSEPIIPRLGTCLDATDYYFEQYTKHSKCFYEVE